MDPVRFIEETTTKYRPLFQAHNRAMWDAATSGTAEANQREMEAQAAVLRFWADRDRFETAYELDQEGHSDPMIARQVRLIHLAAAREQQDQESIEQITEIEARVREAHYGFRAQIDGQRLNDNQLEEILRKNRDSDRVEQAWKASKEIGEMIADDIRQLAVLRNAAAEKQGFRDHFEKTLLLEEIVEDDLLDLFEALDEATSGPFAELKTEIDERRSERFGVPVGDLQPWHYHDRFFQYAPPISDYDLDALYEGQDPVPLALATYDGLGLEVRDILERSDLYAREGKNQHAFCLDLDRSGDIRTLNNLEPTRRWIETLHHELGHAVYYKEIDPDLPWFLRDVPHTLSTEAVAILMGNLTTDPEWLQRVLGVSESESSLAAEAARQRERARALIFTRWVLVMTHFERQLYADPHQELNSLWWELVGRYQQLRMPAGRDKPDWAAKYHVGLAPVYYHNYELGELLAAQFDSAIRRQTGGFVGRSETGEWLRHQVFEPGARERWDEHIQSATGEPLNPQYFVDSFG